MLSELSKESFQSFICPGDDEISILDFYADWCQPCKLVKPMLTELGETYSQIQIGTINVDNAPELTEQFRIVSLPTLVFCFNGSERERLVGLPSKEQIIKVVDLLIELKQSLKDCRKWKLTDEELAELNN